MPSINHKYHTIYTSFKVTIKKSRKVCHLLLAILVSILYITFNIYVEGSYGVRSKGRCKNSFDENKDLIYLITKTHEVLDKYKLDYFLMYGSLWGALRTGQPLPWDYDFDFGVDFDDARLVNFDEVQNALLEYNIKMKYVYYSGVYKVYFGTMTGDIMVFKDYYNDGIMRRIGIESWLLFIHYRFYHQYPKRLTQKPLGKKKFAGLLFNVPHQGVEIQKYLYPNNWWVELKPPNCNLTI
ncbi:uncharacterized protein RT0683 [Hydra vulgaris]|uniref:Uncharacterized protein RT0683 n=1 Tax=Hydra vulgaris TaxID=6087 RepID=A0ABM4CH58_HYDVU